jgi:hypothetical protein
VRERPHLDSLGRHLLDAATEVGLVSVDSLPLVVRALQQVGHLVVLRYDSEGDRLVYYTRPARLGKPEYGGDATASDESPRDAALGLVPDAAGQRDEIETAAHSSFRPIPASGSRAGSLGYEHEGSERQALGSITVEGGSWWSAALSVPEGDVGTGRDTLFLRLQRHGSPPVDYRGSVEAELTLPLSEIDAVVRLVAGIVDQARRDGVLTPARPERR